MTTIREEQKKSGFVTLVGRPNVGKSTLVNKLVGQKIAIMSDKPQTTRTRIRGILTTQEGQAVILDTPGMHRPRHRLGEHMVEVAEHSMRDVDILLCVVDAAAGHGSGDDHVLEKVRESRTPSFLILNKIDAIAKEELLTQIDLYRGLHSFVEIVPVSAMTGEQVSILRELIFKYLPRGPFYYPPDAVTDHPERFVIAELIREKVLKLTREEVPHAVAVVVEQIERRDDSDVLYIHANIYAERDSQKAILIGKGGAMLKQVGVLARRDIERILGSKAYLELWVKIKKDWRNHEHWLRSFGLHDE